MNKMVSVGLAIVVRDRKVLICQRLATAAQGGLWEFPGGKIEPGEAPRACALRELKEETGINAEIVEDWPTITFDYPDARVKLHPFLCQHRSGEAQPIACQQLAWVTMEELKGYSFPQANDPLLRRLIELSLPI
jgi:mutator protein MutT